MIEGFCFCFCFSFSFCHIAALPSNKHQATSVANAVAGEQEAASHPISPGHNHAPNHGAFPKILIT
jgi:hypothetical protein